MQVNSDFEQRVALHTVDMPWLLSPSPQVKRKMLDRIGGEVARATSIVRYEPGSTFEAHEHGGGEEILVLDGVFSDEYGDYPAGTYLRNPPGTSHRPHSASGCTLFVKLWQFTADDQSQLCVDTKASVWYPGLVAGLSVLPLHQADGVNTALVRWAPHTQFNRHVHPGGEEILVLEGVFLDENGRYEAGSWLRSPRYSVHTPFTHSAGALIYVKTGHLDAPLLTPPGIATN